MTLLFIAFAAFLFVLAAAVTVYAVFSAKEGFEDEHGFHPATSSAIATALASRGNPMGPSARQSMTPLASA